jgi:hypothetical protein
MINNIDLAIDFSILVGVARGPGIDKKKPGLFKKPGFRLLEIMDVRRAP